MKTVSLTRRPTSLRMRGPEFRLTILVILVVGCYVFPSLWYQGEPPKDRMFWLKEQLAPAGWAFEPIPVPAVAESSISADRYFSGVFRNASGSAVTVFTAKVFEDSGSGMKIFAHTPDTCWPTVGWRQVPIEPSYIEMELHGKNVVFERRLYRAGTRSELVLFGALVGGKPLPYRLNHWQSYSQVVAESGTNANLLTSRFFQKETWQLVVNSFRTQRPLEGAKHFIRLSTAAQLDSLQQADTLLREFLRVWLMPGSFIDDRDGQPTPASVSLQLSDWKS